MSGDRKISFEVSKRYARAVFEVAKNNGELDKVGEDFEDILYLLRGSKEFRRLSEDMMFNRSQKSDILEAIIKKTDFSKTVNDFLRLLVSKRRLNILDDIAHVFSEHLMAYRSEIKAEITVSGSDAFSLKRQRSLSEALAEMLNCKTVVLDIKEDKEIIGGLIVRVGSTLIDNSVKSKMDRLQRKLKSVDLSPREVA